MDSVWHRPDPPDRAGHHFFLRCEALHSGILRGAYHTLRTRLWKEPVPLPDHQSPEHRGIDWAAVGRTLLMQVLVLLALAGAFIGYVNWSSEQALWEFIDASEAQLPSPHRASESAAPVQAVKGQAFCRRKD
jgi:hypothetical protein